MSRPLTTVFIPSSESEILNWMKCFFWVCVTSTIFRERPLTFLVQLGVSKCFRKFQDAEESITAA